MLQVEITFNKRLTIGRNVEWDLDSQLEVPAVDPPCYFTFCHCVTVGETDNWLPLLLLNSMITVKIDTFLRRNLLTGRCREEETCRNVWGCCWSVDCWSSDIIIIIWAIAADTRSLPLDSPGLGQSGDMEVKGPGKAWGVTVGSEVQLFFRWKSS